MAIAPVADGYKTKSKLFAVFIERPDYHPLFRRDDAQRESANTMETGVVNNCYINTLTTGLFYSIMLHTETS